MGNTLIYRGHDLAKHAPRIEEVLRKDLGATAPIPYDVETTGRSGGYVKDVGRLMVGGGLDSIGTIDFTLPWPRRADLVVDATKVGLMTYAYRLTYFAELDRSLQGEIRFDPKAKAFVAAAGEVGPALSRLNAKPDLIERLRKVVRAEAYIGTMRFSGPAGLTIGGDDVGGSVLTLATHARTTGWLQNGATTDAREVLVLAREIERSL